jgi:nitrite reductase/ring-hydroxylating ferredoxin subunit
VRWADSLDAPFETHGAVLLDDQLQVDPMAVVHALAGQVRSHGGTLHEGQRVRDVDRDGDRFTVRLASGGELSTGRVVIATGAPSLSGWLLPGATTGANRSYVIALEGADPVAGMFISAGQPTRSVRTSDPLDGRGHVLVGGSGHTVGRAGSAARHLDELRRWAEQHFPGGVETHAWSAQDYALPDQLPTFGPVPGTAGRIHLATGYDKWGMTNAVAAARAISADILGSPAGWAETLQHRSPSLQTLATVARQVLGVGVLQTKALVRAEATTAPADVPTGSGAVGRSPVWPTAVSRTDGNTCAVSAVCTHAGGILSWNDQEGSWDCPLHGSRFTPDGEVIEGPATRPLTRRDAPHQPAGSGRPSA